MRLLVLAVFAIAITASAIFAQTTDITNSNLVQISNDTSKINRSLEELNKRLATFASTFNSNQGLRLSEKQQKILFAFELLNRYEARLSNIRLLKAQLAERSVSAKRQLAAVEDELRDENIERSVSGSFKPEQVRAERRQSLEAQRRELDALVRDIERSVLLSESESNELERMIYRLRYTLFPEIEKELSEL